MSRHAHRAQVRQDGKHVRSISSSEGFNHVNAGGAKAVSKPGTKLVIEFERPTSGPSRETPCTITAREMFLNAAARADGLKNSVTRKVDAWPHIGNRLSRCTR